MPLDVFRVKNLGDSLNKKILRARPPSCRGIPTETPLPVVERPAALADVAKRHTKNPRPVAAPRVAKPASWCVAGICR